MNGIAAEKKAGFIEQRGRIGLRQLKRGRPRRIEHGRAHGWIVAVAPQRRVNRLGNRVMKVMAHQLELAVDVVVDANNIFTDVGLLRNRRYELPGAQIRMREGASVEFPDGILIDQVGRNRITREGLSSRQTVGRIDRLFSWILGLGNNRDLAVGRDTIGQRLTECGEIGGRDSILHCRCTPLNLPPPLFIHEEKCFLPPQRAAEIAARHVQPELRPRFAC